jgi:hypothetical protein
VLSWDIEISTYNNKFSSDGNIKGNMLICIGASIGTL